MFGQRQLLKIILLPPYVWLVVLLLLPFVFVFTISLSEYITASPPFRLFLHQDQLGKWVISPTFENFKILIEEKFYIVSYVRSLKLALITTIASLIVGYPTALAIANSDKKVHNFLLLLVILPFWTSLIIRVYAWNIILGDSGILNKLLLNLAIIDNPVQFLNSEFAVILGMVYCYLPFMILPIFVIIDKIEPEIIEASLDLGCTPLKSFLRVTLPLSIPGVIAGSMLVMIPAIGEVIIPDLLGGNKILTVGKVIWNEFFHNRDWPVASAITIVLTFTFVIPVMVIQRIVAKKEEQNVQ